tara:strand:- start:47 stop:451 length:405 start_codon:yes stop_codon:yes gene_type:complete
VSKGNVIDLTSRLKTKPVTAQEQYDEYQGETEEIVQKWINYLLDELMETDVADDSQTFARDFVFITEAIRSLVYRNRGEGHMFQHVADKMIAVEIDEEDDMVYAQWMLDVDENIPFPVDPADPDYDLPDNDKGK